MLKKRLFGSQNKKILAMAALAAFALVFGLVGCDMGGGDDNHTHSYSTTWSSNATQHWHECSCGEKTDVANHTFSGDICTVCLYDKSTGSGGGTNGVVTINNLPTVQTSISVGVFDYQGVFNSKPEYDTVIGLPGAGSIAATRPADMPIMSQPVTIYNRVGFSFTTVFTGTGQYLVVISTGNEATLDEPRYYGQVTFTNGNATVNYNNPTFHAGMLGGE